MANNALALRMKYRKFTAEQLNGIIENENSSELEVKVAQEFLDKLGGEAEEQLTPEEEERLAKAEAEYEERQKNRKTPSKSDKSMKEKKSAKADKTPRETKRQNLEESEEIPGMKVGSQVKLKGEDAVGEITRLYKSGDGKEKCMVKFGDDKPIKKRVTALELAEETKAAPAKKTPKKK